MLNSTDSILMPIPYRVPACSFLVSTQPYTRNKYLGHCTQANTQWLTNVNECIQAQIIFSYIHSYSYTYPPVTQEHVYTNMYT